MGADQGEGVTNTTSFTESMKLGPVFRVRGHRPRFDVVQQI